MSKRAEELALKMYPVFMWYDNNFYSRVDSNREQRVAYKQGYEQAEKDTIERIISYLEDCDLDRTVLDFDRDGYATVDFESLERLIRKAIEE